MPVFPREAATLSSVSAARYVDVCMYVCMYVLLPGSEWYQVARCLALWTGRRWQTSSALNIHVLRWMRLFGRQYVIVFDVA